MKWIDSLRKWREDRGITYQGAEVYDQMMIEEDNEYYEAHRNNDWPEKVDAICDKIVLTENQIALMPNSPNGKETKKLYRSMVKKFKEDLLGLGVDPDLAMKQTLKEISSRKQDPDQAKRWAQLKADGKPIKEKWQKDKKQDPSTLYKANYLLAKK